jgi:shikimate kinase
MGSRGIVLIGMAGVGKSTIGRALAGRLGWDFIDLDLYLLQRYGKTPQQVIDGQGEAGLIQLEDRCLREIGLERTVVSPGGSIVYDTGIIDYLRQGARLVYLEDSFENIEQRLANAPSRGIVGLRARTLREIYEERLPLYLKYADITVSIGGKARCQVVAEILRRLRSAR